MSYTYLTTEELSERIKYDPRTIRNCLKDSVLIEGVHSTMIGALVLSRSVNNEQLSEQFLGAAANSVQRASTATKA
jgi:hypothetical protein